MPREHDQIRTAIGRGLALDNLREITDLSLSALQSNTSAHPAVFMVLASLSRWVADAWEDIPLPSEVADRIDSALRPCMEALLNASDDDPAEVCAVLDTTAKVFRDAVKRGLDT